MNDEQFNTLLAYLCLIGALNCRKSPLRAAILIGLAVLNKLSNEFPQ